MPRSKFTLAIQAVNKALEIQAASCIFSSAPPAAPAPRPPWPELISYIRKLDFQSSSFSLSDRTSTVTVIRIVLRVLGS